MLRLAGRDMRSQRLRTVLTVLLVALPVLVVSAGMTLIATYDVSAGEAIPRDLGRAQAGLSFADAASPVAITQTYGDVAWTASTRPAKPVSGRTADGQLPSAAAVQAVTGATVIARSTENVRVISGERRVRAILTGLDGRNAMTAGKQSLQSGHWPQDEGQVVVSQTGKAAGLPTSGKLVLASADGTRRTVDVVGTVRTNDSSSIVGLPRAAYVDSYLLGGPVVRWPQVQRLNAYGLVVDSRYFREHPVSKASSASGGSNASVMVLIVTGVVIMTVLLAGPALTIGGTRHRRTLAQLASNGATSAMLRRYVFGQAILLGAISAAAGVVGGCLLGLLGVRVILWVRPTTAMGPTDVPVTSAVGLALVAAIACLVAALIPARQAARTDVVASLRGQVSPRRIRRGLPIVGLIVAICGGALLFRSALQLSGGELGIAAGGVLLFLGATLCLPALMAFVGRSAHRLPLAGRIGVRDVSRQRGRSASAVGATMAVVAVTTALAIGGGSDITQQRHDYQPQALMGEGVITGSSAALRGALGTLPKQVPSVSLAAVSTPAASPYQLEPPTTPGASSGRLSLLATLPPGCTLDGAFASASSGQLPARCAAPSNTTNAGIGIVDAGTLSRVLGLSAAVRTVLDQGGMLVLVPEKATTDGGPMIDPVRNGAVRLAIATGVLEAKVFRAQSARTVTLPAATVRSAAPGLSELQGSSDVRAVMTPQTASRLGVATTVAKVLVTEPGGLRSNTEQAVSDRLPDESYLAVERGFDSSSIHIIWMMITVMAVLLLIVTVVGTALVQGESAPDVATLGALGAASGVRRRIAAAQALALGLTGSVVGLLVGLVPGIAVTWPLTNTAASGDPTAPLPGPTIDIPWMSLALVVIGVPLLAAAVAVIVQRRPASLTARTT